MKLESIEEIKRDSKLPENSKRVFSGILFDVYHWEQEMFDGSFKTFEAIKRIDTVQIIAITPEKKIILLKEKQPHVGSFISVPGGQVERHQNSFEAANVELLEEIGAKTDHLILWKKVPFGKKIIWDSYYYIAKDIEFIQKQKLDIGEEIQFYEVNFDEFLEETQKKEFRNRHMSDMIFRIIHTPGEIEKFKELLFD